LVDGAVGLVVGGFDLGQWCGGLGWAVVEEAVGKRATDALVEKDEEQSGAGALVSEAIGVAAALSLQQCVSFEFAQVVAQLGKGITGGGEAEAGEDGLMDLGGAPSQDLGAGMQQHLHEAQHTGVMDFDAGSFAHSRGNGQGQALEQRKIDVHVQGAGLKGGKAVGDGGQGAADLVEVIERFFKPKSFRLLLSASRRRKVENFSYMRMTAFLA
jgi:hypothetical protein